LIRVVFPAPFGPSSPKNSPTPTSRSMPASARTGPNDFFSSRIETATVIGTSMGPDTIEVLHQRCLTPLIGSSRGNQFFDTIKPGQREYVGRDIDAADLAVLAGGVALPLE